MFSEDLLEKIHTYTSREDIWRHCLEMIRQFRDHVAELGWQAQPRIPATESFRCETADSMRDEILSLAAIMVRHLRGHDHAQDADRMEHWLDICVKDADLTDRACRDLVQDVLVGLAGRCGVVAVT